MPEININGQPISSFTIVIQRGGVFINEWKFLAENGTPDATLDAKIIVEPREGPNEEWNAANGRFTNVGTGTYLLDLNETYTAAITWDFADYHLYVVESSGFVVPCITSGFVFAQNC